jgi:hypothetical protein
MFLVTVVVLNVLENAGMLLWNETFKLVTSYAFQLWWFRCVDCYMYLL